MRRLLVIAVLGGLLAIPSSAHAAPDTSTKCTPLANPITCIYTNGSGLHVNYFQVQLYPARDPQVDPGDLIQGYARIRHTAGGPIIFSRFVTFNAPTGWINFQFTAAKNYPDGYVACAQFFDTTPGGEFSSYQPCATIHSFTPPQADRADQATFEIRDLFATPTPNGGVVFETTVENLTSDTWKLALTYDVLGVAELGPVVDRGTFTAHEVRTIQLGYRPPGPGHYTVVVEAWGKSPTASWSAWAGASAGFTIT